VNPVTKVVASVLALVLSGMPVAALASCRSGTAMAGHCGGEHCPMMPAQQNASTQGSGAPSGGGSCCQVSSTPETSAKLAINREGKTSAPPLNSTVIAAAPVAMSVETPPAPAPAVKPFSRALLCTFLI